jgi:hypothetical protein
MDECLKALSLKQECSTDEMFCCQVRLQLIAAKAIQLSSNQTTSISDGVKVPVMFHIKALRAELLAVNAIMCHGVVQNRRCSICNTFARLGTYHEQRFSLRLCIIQSYA